MKSFLLRAFRGPRVAAAVARLPRPLRLAIGRLLRDFRPQHRWVYAGWSAIHRTQLWECAKCGRIVRGPKPRTRR